MNKNAQRTPLERQLRWAFFLISLLATLLSLCFTLYSDISRQQRAMDASITGSAAFIASMPEVADMLEQGYPDESAFQAIDLFCATIPDVNVILICDRNGLRFYHTNRQTTGDTLIEDDAEAVLAGAEPYITTGYGTIGSQRRAFHAVYGQDGQIIGYVMASVFYRYISGQIHSILLIHAAILLVMALAGFFASHTVVRYLHRSLMGFHPEDLLEMYIRQDEVLNAVEEGIVASGSGGTILFSNLTARKLLTGGTKPLSGPIASVFPDSMQEDVIASGQAVHNRTAVIGGKSLLVSEVPIRKGPKAVEGVLTVLMDRTEVRRLSDELSGARSMLDTLRAFNHEFLNKLHVILGYLQTGDTQRAIRFITNSTRISSEDIRLTADCIRVTSVCALVIGKMMHAAELGIALTLAGSSTCREEDLLISPDDCVTIIGNLLENAIEELSSAPETALKEIHLGLYCRADCNIFICEDTGRGIPPELLGRIWDKGVSSKGENRGTGLYLIKKIAGRCCGEVSIDTEAGEGTCFTITFTKERQATHVPGYHC